jgi:hypothetical protein
MKKLKLAVRIFLHRKAIKSEILECIQALSDLIAIGQNPIGFGIYVETFKELCGEYHLNAGLCYYFRNTSPKYYHEISFVLKLRDRYMFGYNNSWTPCECKDIGTIVELCRMRRDYLKKFLLSI